jgi:hypothetical protein
VSVTGARVLPTGVAAENVTVVLRSATQNLSLPGGTYIGHFLASPGTYSYYASAPSANASYASIGSVTIGSSGAVSGSINLGAGATRVIANLTRPGGALLIANVSLTIQAPGGLSLPATAHSGQATVLLPAGFAYGFTVYSCSVTGTTTFCNIPLLESPVLSSVSGTLTFPGYPGPLNGEVQFIGPSPSVDATTVTVSNGSFTAALSPGTYSVYAIAGGASAPVANL